MVRQPDRILLTEQIKSHSKFVKGNVLDVGSGSTNRYSKFFKFDKYTTVDIVDTFGPDIVASATDLPLGNNIFDTVFSTQVLEHISEPEKALSEMYRVLKKNGTLVITVPQWNELHEEPYDFYRYIRFGMKHLLEKVGFKIIKIDQRGGFWSMSAQLNIRFLIDSFNLYKHPIFSFILSPFIFLYCNLMMFLDKISKKNKNYQKHILGYLIVARK